MRKERKVILLLAGILFLCLGGLSDPAWGQNTLIQGSSVSAKPGQTVEVPIYLHFDDGTAIAALQFDLRYDSDSLTLLSVKAGGSLAQSNKQLVSRRVDPVDDRRFSGRTGESQYLDMRKKKKDVPGDAPVFSDPEKKSAAGRERVLITGLNNYSMGKGKIAIALMQVNADPRGTSWTIDFSDVSVAGPDAKTVVARTKAGQIRLIR